MTYPDTPGYVDLDTSKAAARSIEPEVSKIAARVLAYIAEKPRTCWEVESWMGLSHQTASARIRELQMKGRIVDSGERRRTNSGRMAAVWRVTVPGDPAPPALAAKACPHCGGAL